MAITTDKRRKIFQRDGAECVECGSWDNLTIDHFIPKDAGGTDYVSNLQTLCYTCNQIKGSRMPTEEEIKAHAERLSNIKKNKPVEWGNLKIPNMGMPDGIVAFMKQSTDSAKRKKNTTHIAKPVENKSKPPKNIPIYVKYVEWNVYADFWLGLKKGDVGKTFRTDLDHKTSERWKTALKVHPESYCESDKLQWNLSRDHGVNVKGKPNWCWESYNRSIEERRAALMARQVAVVI